MKITLNLDAGPLEIITPDGDGTQWPMGHPFGYLNRPREIPPTQRYLNNAYSLAKTLPKGQHVVELFGGIGIYPKLFWPLLEPLSWTSVDIDESLGQYYQEPRGTFVAGDAYKFDIPSTTGILYLDHPTGTIQTLARNLDGRRPLYERIKQMRIPHIQIADMGYYWCHLANHHPWYLETFGIKPTKENYHTLWAKWMLDNLHYKMVDYRTGGGCQLFHCVPA